MAKDNSVIERPPFYIVSNPRDILLTALVGVATGLLVWLLAFALKQFLIAPVFCRTADSASVCQSGDQIAFIIATIVMAAVSVAALARIDVFRPLLVSVAAAVTLWNLPSHIGGIHAYAPTFEQIAWTAVLYGLLYVLFSWILRIRNFVGSLISAVVLVIVLRLLLVR
jgi:hypothetical protein